MPCLKLRPSNSHPISNSPPGANEYFYKSPNSRCDTLEMANSKVESFKIWKSFFKHILYIWVFDPAQSIPGFMSELYSQLILIGT